MRKSLGCRAHKEEATLIQAATEMLAKITWTLNHASDLVMTTARGNHLNDMDDSG